MGTAAAKHLRATENARNQRHETTQMLQRTLTGGNWPDDWRLVNQRDTDDSLWTRLLNCKQADRHSRDSAQEQSLRCSRSLNVSDVESNQIKNYICRAYIYESL